MHKKCMGCLIVQILLMKGIFTEYIGESNYQSNDHSRTKRWLLYPPGTNVVQLIVSIGIPVEVTPEAVLFGYTFRAFYNLASNLSELMPMDYGATSKKRSISRWELYKMLELESESRGYGGRSCILQSICEASDTPFNRFNSIFEEIFHSIFTPTSTQEEIEHHTDNEYYAAQELGRKNKGSCKKLFPDCKLSPVDYFSYAIK